METIPQPPHTGDALLFVLTGAQCELAQRQRVAGTNAQRLALIKEAVAGQPLFIFDADARVLHGPFVVDGPGGLNLDGGTSRLPAQVRFRPTVRTFQPLPESSIADLLPATKRPPAATEIESDAVAQLLWQFVLRHHALLE